MLTSCSLRLGAAFVREVDELLSTLQVSPGLTVEDFCGGASGDW